MSSLNFVELKNRSKLTIELERIRGNPKIVWLIEDLPYIDLSEINIG